MSKKRIVIVVIEHVVFALLVVVLVGFVIEGPISCRCSLTSNDSSVQGTLKTIITAQAQMKANAWIDVDKDGIGEYGTLGQLAEINKCDNGSGEPMAINPPYITAVLGIEPDGVNYPLKSGYFYKMYRSESANDNEQLFICYAWPQQWGTTGNKAFVVTQEGTVYCTDGKVQVYSGDGNNDGDSVPGLDDACIENEMSPGAWVNRFPILSNGETGTDGNVWKVAGE